MVPVLYFKSFFMRDFSSIPFINSIEERPRARIIRLRGSIAKDAIPQIDKMREEVSRRPDFEKKNTVLDVERVTDFDSATVAALLLWMKQMREDHHRVGFINVREEMKDLAEILQVEKNFEMFESEEDALKELG